MDPARPGQGSCWCTAGSLRSCCSRSGGCTRRWNAKFALRGRKRWRRGLGCQVTRLDYQIVTRGRIEDRPREGLLPDRHQVLLLGLLGRRLPAATTPDGPSLLPLAWPPRTLPCLQTQYAPFKCNWAQNTPSTACQNHFLPGHREWPPIHLPWT